MKRVLDPNGYPCPVVGCTIVCATPGQLGGHVSSHQGATPHSPGVTATVTLYCECGSALTLRGETNEAIADTIEQLWRQEHLTRQQHALVSANESNLQREYRRRRVGAR